MKLMGIPYHTTNKTKNSEKHRGNFIELMSNTQNTNTENKFCCAVKSPDYLTRRAGYVTVDD